MIIVITSLTILRSLHGAKKLISTNRLKLYIFISVGQFVSNYSKFSFAIRKNIKQRNNPQTTNTLLVNFVRMNTPNGVQSIKWEQWKNEEVKKKIAHFFIVIRLFFLAIVSSLIVIIAGNNDYFSSLLLFLVRSASKHRHYNEVINI